MKTVLYAALLLFGTASAQAAGSAAGRSYAAGEASGRLSGAALVEVDGFADEKGGIPCGKKAYSSSWHYKFYSKADQAWTLVNACGSLVVNSAAHRPARPASEPRTPLPADLADSSDVAAALEKEAFLSVETGSLNRDLYLKAAWLPASGARPEGCYWEASRGGKKALLDCVTLKRFTAAPAAKAAAHGGVGGSPAGAAAGGGKAAKPAAKGSDGAAKYYKVISESVAASYPGAVLRSVEALTHRDGAAKCVTPDDGWTYVYTAKGLPPVVVGGCRNKTAFLGTDFTGRFSGLSGLNTLPVQFKDSSVAAEALPASCPASKATLVMKLRSYKTPPVHGAGVVWEVACGGETHYVDALLGRYLGVGKGHDY